ncbi:calponin homology domain-containing protein DDB_G0272472 [Apis florea]|uniref:calponin homology domain-containing protein DDB_G0272472 n=1 Tax=Apis florea TaxID=7463 RepID=UPI0006290365|nr:calponin homology domain-containing protein DDB_G0272472 [Apis florea]
MIQMNEVTNLMDRLMKVNIFHPSEKLRMLKDEEKTFLDPNIIMNERHRILQEKSNSPFNGSVLKEAKKLLIEEEIQQLHIKKQQRVLERELKKFEMELSKSRPKFSNYTCCTKRNFVSSDDEDFWKTARKLKNKIIIEEKRDQINGSNESTDVPITEINDSLLEIKDQKNQSAGKIKITIKDKINFKIETQRLFLLKKYFDILKCNVVEEKRFRDIKTKIEENMVSKIKRKYFDIWRTHTKDAKINGQKQKEEEEIFEKQKIEMFINKIMESQNAIMGNQKIKISDNNLMIKESNSANKKKKNTYYKHIIVESPAQYRLNAQKQIIEKQKAKLAEQNRIIEELKLKQMQKEISNANKETIDIAKQTFSNCGHNTRRTLIQLMQQNGYRDESLMVPRKRMNPPIFLLRMEARAEERRKRIKLAAEIRKQKLEEQKRMEEASRLEEEQKKKRLQQEALAEAKRLQKEQEQNRQREIEKFQKLNNVADEFYRQYLLRHYIMKPFVILIEELRGNIKKAEDHYREKLTKKIFTTWKKEIENQYKIKIDTVKSIYNTKLILRIFREWKQEVRELKLKYQVAIDFYDMKLLDNFFKLWQIITIELKTKTEIKEKLIINIYENKLKIKYFNTWKKYLTIATNIKESEKRKDELRQLVLKVIPDFDPKQRGVISED